MRGKSSNSEKIKREEADLERLLLLMPDNPVLWTAVVKLVGPVIARLAARYVLKRIARGMSEDKVNTIGDQVANFIGTIVQRRLDG